MTLIDRARREHGAGIHTSPIDPMTNSHLPRPWRIAFPVVVVCALGISTGQPLAAQQVGISVLPTAQRVQWSDDFALDDDHLYGGRLGLRFGKWVELQPFYFMRNGMGLDTTRAASVFGAPSRGRTVDLKHYGTTLQFNLSDGALVPFARVGAGVLRLEPDSGSRTDRITVSAGGGLRFGVAGLNAEVFAEQMGFRMNPRSLFGPDTTTGARLLTLRNFVYGAAVTIPLSTMREDDGNDGGLSGSTIPVEPFVGVLRYDGAHRLPDLEVAGVRAGIDFSPVFGIRGFYWRGVNDDRDGPAPVAGYGGEAQFNLNTGAGVSPYLIAGAGQVDYRDSFRDSLGVSRDDKTAFIVGGGASFRLTDRLRVNGAIRDYIMTMDETLENVANTRDLTHNTMITAGLTISFGGHSSPSSAQRGRERDAEVRELKAERDRALRDREGRDRDERDRDVRDRALRDRDRRDMPDSMRMMRDSIGTLLRAPAPGYASPDRQWITVPVPVQGEIILRYGVPASMPRTERMEQRERMDRLERVVRTRGDSVVVRRDTVMMAPAMPPAAMPPAADISAELRELERRLSARIDALQVPAAPAAMPAMAPVIAPAVAPAVDRNATPVFERLTRTRVSDLRPYVGVGFNDGDTQVVFGARADLGPITPSSGFHFMPELAVGFGGDGTSVLAFANVQYAFGSVGGTSAFRPYATLGAGVFSPTVLGLNTAIGSSYVTRRTSGTPLVLNLELQGINLFNETRVLFGVSRNR